MSCVYIQAERMAKDAVQKGQLSRFQVAEYYAEFYKQSTGHPLPEEFNPSKPKEFFRKWNGAKRSAVKQYKRARAEHDKVTATLEDKMPLELLIATEMRRLRREVE